MYSKLYQAMFDGSLATRGPWQALVTFQQLLILSDRFGIVDMTLPAIQRRTTLPMEVLEVGLAELLKPDPESRRPDHEGRRIIPIAPDRDWGWQIVNHAHYRQLRSAEERRDYQRSYMRDWRSGKRRRKGKSGAQASPSVAPADSSRDDADGPAAPDPAWLPADLFAAWWQARPKRTRTDRARALAIAKLDRLRAQGHAPEAVLEHCVTSGYQALFAPKEGTVGPRSGTPQAAPRPSITCSDCGERATTWTGTRCDKCHRAYMGSA